MNVKIEQGSDFDVGNGQNEGLFHLCNLPYVTGFGKTLRMGSAHNSRNAHL